MSSLASIIIPCYNAAHWLPAALDSALAQTHRPLEIIVVDDGSTDASPAILADYASRHPDTLRVLTQPNRGQCAAANAGLAVSRGEYIKFFDADDLLSPGAVAAQLTTLEHNPRCIAHAAWSRFRDNLNEADFTHLPAWRDDSAINWIALAWGGGRPMHQCGIFLIPRVLLEEKGGWDERLSLINDFEFFTRIILASDGIRFTPEAKLYYRSGLAGSLSTQRTRAAWESAYLSATLAVTYLLAAEDSPRTRRAAADCLRELIFNIYPAAPDLVARLEDRIKSLAPESAHIGPGGGKAFRAASALLGWKLARRLQLMLRQ